MMDKNLEKEFNYYLDHQKELIKKYDGKFIVVKDCTVIGSYNRHEEAYSETVKTHELGTFLIQLCSPGDESYTFTFHSNVSFSF